MDIQLAVSPTKDSVGAKGLYVSQRAGFPGDCLRGGYLCATVPCLQR